MEAVIIGGPISNYLIPLPDDTDPLFPPPHLDLVFHLAPLEPGLPPRHLVLRHYRVHNDDGPWTYLCDPFEPRPYPGDSTP